MKLSHTLFVGGIVAIAAISDLSATSLSHGAVCPGDDEPLTWVEMPAGFDPFVFELDRRWSETASEPGPLRQGDPTTITWGVVPDGTFIPNFFGEPSANSNLRALLDSLYGSESAWMPLFQAAFGRWEQLTGVDFVFEPNDDGANISTGNPGALGIRPDVRIGGKLIDGDGGGLAYGLFPQIGDIVLDSADSKYDDTSNDSFNLKQIVMHEIGHALGIDHVCPQDETKIMEPRFIDAFFGPQIDDISAGQRGYGDRHEPNDSPGLARTVGTLAAGATTKLRLVSIDDGDDIDFYRFSLAAPRRVTVSLVPMGQVYPSESEGPGGGCDGSAPSYDGVQVHDLGFLILDSSSSVIAAASTGTSGDSEQIEIDLPPDDYAIAVQGSSSTDAMQLYSLWITAGGYRISPPSPGVAGVTNTIDLQGAAPGGDEFLVFSLGSGRAPVPTCDRSELDSVQLIETDGADGDGDLTFSFTPPPGAAGRTGFFQVLELGSCSMSNPVTATF